MGLDIRHLAISLVAVFIALLTGLLAGIAITNEPTLEKLTDRFEREFAEVTQKLRNDLQQLQEEKSAVQQQAELTRRFIHSLAPIAVDGRLNNTRVLVVQTGGLQNFGFKNQLSDILQRAGAEVVGIVVLRPQLMQLTGDQRQAVIQRLAIGPIDPTQTNEKVSRQVAKLLAGEDTQGGLSWLKSQQLLTYSGAPQQPVTHIVLVGGSDEPLPQDEVPAGEHEPTVTPVEDGGPDELDAPMIEVWREMRVRTVGCEPTHVTSSVIPVYQSAQIPTVDNVDSIMGQIATVLVCAGADGHFGIKETADALLPALPMLPAVPPVSAVGRAAAAPVLAH